MPQLLRYALFAVSICTTATPALSATVPLDESLIVAAPAADPKVIRLALDAASCAALHGEAPVQASDH